MPGFYGDLSQDCVYSLVSQQFFSLQSPLLHGADFVEAVSTRSSGACGTWSPFLHGTDFVEAWMSSI